ncbi:MAG: hypothetical protein AB1500_07135 [Bacillota bacterium]
MKQRFNEKGFTLVEAVLTVTLTALLFLGGGLLYRNSLEQWYWADRQSEVQDNLRIGMERIVRDVRLATDITEPVPGAEGPTLILKQGTGNIITYELDADGELQIRRASAQPVTTGVITAVYFSRTAANPRLVNITISGRSPENPELPVVTVRTAAYARLAP